MIHVHANAAVGAAFDRARGWDAGAAPSAEETSEKIVTGGYDFLVPFVAVGFLLLTFSGGGKD